MTQKRIKYLLISISIFLVGFVVYFGFEASNSFYPDQQIQTVSKTYLSFFEKNAKYVEESLYDFKSSLDTLDFNNLSQDMFVQFLMKKLNENKQISSILLLEHGKKISILEKDHETYLFAVDSSVKTDVVRWQRLDKELQLKNSWDRALGVQLNVLEWGGEVFNDSYKFGIPIWTSVGRLIEDGRRSTAAHITWKSSLSNQLLTCIVIINDLTDFEILPQDGALKVQRFIVNSNDHVFQVFSENKNDSLVENLRVKSIKSWEITGSPLNSTFNFAFNNSNYWGQSLESEIVGIKSLIVVIEENTLRLSLIYENYILLIVMGILALILLVIYILKRSLNSNTLDTYINSQVSDQHASELIKLGENNQLEFKSSFRYDYKLEKVNKDLEFVISKSIAAFSNGKGGTLLIGVDDNGNVLGLENDISTLKRKDIDFFENFLRTFLNNLFSIGFVSNNLTIKFPVVEKKLICRIDVQAGNSPVFVEIIKNNVKAERFYVRSGNTSMEMKNLSEINSYIQNRF
jgi:hypothetical protein